MPFGGNDWLALTQEPTLEPDLPNFWMPLSFWSISSLEGQHDVATASPRDD